MASALGYHSVGMKPVGGSMAAESDVGLSCVISITATAFSDAHLHRFARTGLLGTDQLGAYPEDICYTAK